MCLCYVRLCVQCLLISISVKKLVHTTLVCAMLDSSYQCVQYASPTGIAICACLMWSVHVVTDSKLDALVLCTLVCAVHVVLCYTHWYSHLCLFDVV